MLEEKCLGSLSLVGKQRKRPWKDPGFPWKNPTFPWKVPGFTWKDPGFPWKEKRLGEMFIGSKIRLRDLYGKQEVFMGLKDKLLVNIYREHMSRLGWCVPWNSVSKLGHLCKKRCH